MAFLVASVTLRFSFSDAVAGTCCGRLKFLFIFIHLYLPLEVTNCMTTYADETCFFSFAVNFDAFRGL